MAENGKRKDAPAGAAGQQRAKKKKVCRIDVTGTTPKLGFSCMPTSYGAPARTS
jgi:hypothetical protein